MRKPPRVRRSPDQILSILKDFRRSGQSASAFAAAAGVSPTTFAYWLKRYSVSGAARRYQVRRDRAGHVRFLKVNPLPHAVGGAAIEIALPSGVRLVVTAEVDPQQVVALVKALESC